MLQKVKWYYGGDRKYSAEGNLLIIENDKEKCSKIISAKQPCSCPMCCGNPRRIRGRNYITRQEIKSGIAGKLRS
jgi:hypothetical protein